MPKQTPWSFLRSVLSQGAAVQQDYTAGKYNYEEYSARLDAAAREREDELQALAQRDVAEKVRELCVNECVEVSNKLSHGAGYALRILADRLRALDLKEILK